jgi:hypothetical protein
MMLSGDSVLQVLFGAGHESDAAFFKAVQPFEVQIAPIERNDAVWQEVKIEGFLAFGDPNFVVFGIGQNHECRQRAAVIEEVV